MLNSELIGHVDATPDTVVSLTTGEKIMVLESADEIISRIVDFRAAISLRSAQLQHDLRELMEVKST